MEGVPDARSSSLPPPLRHSTRLPALPGALVEVELFCQRMAAVDKRVIGPLTGWQLTSDTVDVLRKQTSPTHPAAIMLFSAHFEEARHRGEFCGFALAGGSSFRVNEWGRTMPFADMYFLGGCSSGTPMHDGDHSVRALLPLGPRYVVTAMWPVSDSGALVLSNTFFEQLQAASARNPPAALTATQSELVRCSADEMSEMAKAALQLLSTDIRALPGVRRGLVDAEKAVNSDAYRGDAEDAELCLPFLGCAPQQLRAGPYWWAPFRMFTNPLQLRIAKSCASSSREDYLLVPSIVASSVCYAHAMAAVGQDPVCMCPGRVAGFVVVTGPDLLHRGGKLNDGNVPRTHMFWMFSSGGKCTAAYGSDVLDGVLGVCEISEDLYCFRHAQSLTFCRRDPHGITPFHLSGKLRGSGLCGWPAPRLECPAGHALSQASTTASGVVCDFCGYDYGAMFGCRTCNFDLCESCATDKTARVAAVCYYPEGHALFIACVHGKPAKGQRLLRNYAWQSWMQVYTLGGTGRQLRKPLSWHRSSKFEALCQAFPRGWCDVQQLQCIQMLRGLHIACSTEDFCPPSRLGGMLILNARDGGIVMRVSCPRMEGFTFNERVGTVIGCDNKVIIADAAGELSVWSSLDHSVGSLTMVPGNCDLLVGITQSEPGVRRWSVQNLLDTPHWRGNRQSIEHVVPGFEVELFGGY
ncbi:unnamed protein product [Prorocentrum cordatum]|uniref:CHAT domain-containing protein n=1 Tax=Prorocentrum cordatum TaxID=2364126 RepID=A0ABN9XCG5_9DINO|nr:unnamed protein product [Polarella glacialis]